MTAGARTLNFSMTCLSSPSGARIPDSEVAAWRKSDGFTHIVDLRAGFATVWASGFTQDARRCVRRARDRGVSVASGRTTEMLEAVYGLYRSEARRGRWNVVYPIAYFQSLIAAFPSARIWAAHVGRRLAAGKILVTDGRWTISRLGVVDPRCRHACPHHLLWSEIMEEAAGSGVAWADLGPSGGDEAMVRFKASLGARPLPFRSTRWHSPLGRAWGGIREAGRRLGALRIGS
jgi:hypothetical protein